MDNKKNKESRYNREFLSNNNTYIRQQKKIYIRLLVIAVILISIVCGTSYAFYSLTIKSDKKIEMTAGKFKINFNEGNSIKLENAVPMSDTEGLANDLNNYTFDITNGGDIDSRYNLYLEEVDINKDTLDKKYIKYSIREDDGEWSTPQLLSNGLFLRRNVLLKASENKKYELKLWLTEEAGNETQGKTFNAKVVVDAVQHNATLEDKTQPIINISNTSINVSTDSEFIEPEPYDIKDANGENIDIENIVKTYEYYDGLNIVPVDGIDTSNPGVYYIYYRVTDQNGNEGCTVVVVNVLSPSYDEPPVILLKGESNIEIKKGEEYIEPGVTVTDKEDANLDNKVVVIGNVNTNMEGNYVIKYIIEDSSGNIVSAVRTVSVIHKGNININIGKAKRSDGKWSIPLKFESTDSNLVGYYVSKSDVRPMANQYTKIDKVNKYDIDYEINDNGTYYIWVLDSEDNVVSDHITVDNIDNNGPVCRFSDEHYMTTGEKLIDLICTDESEIENNLLENDDFEIDDPSVASISYVSGGAAVENGYKYTITLNGHKAGNFNITLNKGVISDIYDNKNTSVTKTMEVKKIKNEDITIDGDIGDSKLSVEDGKLYLKLDMNSDINLSSRGFGDGIKYIVDNDNITIDNSGNIKANNIGISTITCIDEESGASIEIYVTIIKKVHVTYNKNGRGINEILDLKSTNTTCELNPTTPDSCSIILPEFNTKKPYEVVGWGTSADSHIGYEVKTELEISDDLTLYTISRIPEKEYTVVWDENGSEIEGGDNSCSVNATYNDEEYDDKCYVDIPKIKPGNNTPNIVGWNTSSNAHENMLDNMERLELNKDNDKNTYYAITKSDAITYTATFRENGYAASNISYNELSCTIGETYNNEKQLDGCNVKLPSVDIEEGYALVGWNSDKTATEVLDDSGNITINGNVTLYTITKSKAKDINISFNKNGLGVSKIGSNILSCTTTEIYNPESAVTASCSVSKEQIPRIEVYEGYTALGWNSNSNAKEDGLKTDTKGNIVVEENTEYYSISKKEAIKLTAKFNSNGAKISSEEESCWLDEVYNNDKQDEFCEIDTPTITRDGYDIIGYGDLQLSDKIFNDGSKIALTNDTTKNDGVYQTGKTWYAQTSKEINIIFNQNGSALSSINNSCVMRNTDESCSILSPTITRDGFNIIGFSINADSSTSEWNQNTVKNLSNDSTYYAITSKDISAKFNYYSENSKKSVTSTCTIRNTADSCNVGVPDAVINSTGPSETDYIGLSTKLDSVDVSLDDSYQLSKNQIYNAVYTKDFYPKFYYYDSDNNETLYNDTVAGLRTAVIKELDGEFEVTNGDIEIPSVVINSKGIDNAEFMGVSARINDREVLDSNPTTANDNYYAIYKGSWKLTYTRDLDSVSRLTKNNDSCDFYQTSNGSNYSSSGVDCGIELPAIQLKTGFENAKWYDGDTAVGGAGADYTITGNKELIARGTISILDITYDCATNGGTCDIPVEKVTYDDYADLTKHASKDGYEFLGWNTNKDATEPLEDLIITGDTTLYAIFKRNETATFNYNANGEKTTKKINCTIYNTEPSCLHIPTEVSSSSGANGTEYLGVSDSIDSMSITNKLESEKTYYAIYQTKVKQYLKDVNSNNDSREIYRNSYFTSNGTLTTILGDTKTAISNFTISDVSNKILGSGLSTTDTAEKGKTVSDFVNTTDTILYTTYKEQINVDFIYYNNTEQRQVSSDVISGIRYYNYNLEKRLEQNIEIPNIVTTSTGFDGVEGQGNFIGVSTNISTYSDAKLEGITTAYNRYYAVYKGKWQIKYSRNVTSVRLVGRNTDSCDNYQTSNGSNYSSKGVNCEKELPSIELKYGFEKSQWYDGTTPVGKPNDNYIISGDKELVAKGSRTSFNVVYDCATNGGTCEETTESVTYEDYADLTKEASKNEYDFLGWNTNKDATVPLEDLIITEDTTLYAIFRKTTTISLDVKEASYDGNPISANEAVVADGNLSYPISYVYYTNDKCTTKVPTSTGASSEGNPPVNVGLYYVKATTTALNGNKVSSYCTPHIISKKSVTVTARDQIINYGGQIASGVSNAILSNQVSGHTLNSISLSTNNTFPTSTGEIMPSNATIYNGDKNVTSNYAITYNTGNLIINKKTLTVSVEASNKTYDGNNSTTCNVTLKGAVNNDNPTIVNVTGEFDGPNVGTSKTVTCSNIMLDPISSNYYQLDTTTKNTSATISKKAVSITAHNQTITYGEQINSSVSNATLSGQVNGHILNSVSLKPNTTNATTSGTITPSGAVIYDGVGSVVTSNYAITYNTGNLIINRQKSATIGECNSLIYNGYSQPLASGATHATYSGNSKTDAGSYTVTINADSNYAFGDGSITTTKTCSIAQKTLDSNSATITLNPTSYTYDGNAKKPAVTVKDKDRNVNLTSNDYDVSYSNNINAGTAKSTITGKGNYKGSVDKTYTINRSPTATKGSCKSLTYTGSAQTLASGATHATYSNNSKTDAGSYTVTINADSNYAFEGGATSTTLNCSITPAKATEGSCNSLTYTGSAQTLASGATHATYSGNSKTDAGSYTVTINADSNYAFGDGSITTTKTCSIAQKTLDGNSATITLNPTSYTYDGNAKKPAVTVKDKNRNANLTSNDYDVSYSNNINAGTAKATITGKGNYKGSVDKTYTINKSPTATKGSCNSLTYTGSAQTLASGATHATYSNNSKTNAGSYTVTINADSNYAFEGGATSTTLNCSITPAKATEGSCNSLTYTGSAQTLASGATHATYSNNSKTDAGSYTVTINANPNYAFGDGSITTTKTCSIAQKTLDGNSATITLNPTSYTYDGNAKKPAVTVKDKNRNANLTSNDYDVSYSNNINAGTAKATITGKGNYKGSVDKTYTINKSPTATKGSCNSLTYTGSAQTLASGATHATYSNNSKTNAGSYTVTINADSNYAFEGGATSTTLNCSIAKSPTATAGECINNPYTPLYYTGSAQTLVSGATHATYSGNSKTDAGSYTVTVTADSNYTFGDGSITTTKNCSIAKSPTAAVGSCINPTFNGSSQDLATSGSGSSCSANCKGTNAGTYTLTFKADSNHTFNGSSTKTKSCSIKSLARFVDYDKGVGVSQIGKTRDSCSISSGTDLTCTVSLPTITVKTGYTNPYWSFNKGISQATGQSPGSSILLNSDSASATARGEDTTKPRFGGISGSAICTSGQICTGHVYTSWTDNANDYLTMSGTSAVSIAGKTYTTNNSVSTSFLGKIVIDHYYYFVAPTVSETTHGQISVSSNFVKDASGNYSNAAIATFIQINPKNAY